MAKTNTGLVEYAKAQIGKPYWYGTFGQEGTQSLLNYKTTQYPEHYTSGRMSKYKKQISQKVKVHDCIGLVKGYLWCDGVNDMTPNYNAAQDKGADGMYNICKERGKISTMPELPGVLVFSPGHVGVYIGNGYVVEARGFNYGVVKTRLKDRGWTKWGKCPYIKYVTEPKKTTTTTTSTAAKTYSKTQFIKDVQKATGSKVDGIAGAETLRNTVTVSRYKNSRHAVVKAIQKRLNALGYSCGTADGIAGVKFEAAVKKYQKAKGCFADGEITARNYTWKKLLGLA